MVYIYALRCPIADSVRYIGKAVNPEKRCMQHVQDALAGRGKHHCAHWIRKLAKENQQPELVVLCAVGEGEWMHVERFFIASARFFEIPLTNQASGGEGVVLIDDEAKARWSEAMREVNARPEVKAARSAQFKRLWMTPEYRAKMHTMQALAKMSVRQRAFLASPEGRASFMVRMRDPERTAKISSAIAKRNVGDSKLHAKVKADWADQEHKSRRLAAMAATKSDPEWRKSFAASVSASWADPSVREKRGALQRRPETRAKRSASIKEWWARRKRASAQQTPEAA